MITRILTCATLVISAQVSAVTSATVDIDTDQNAHNGTVKSTEAGVTQVPQVKADTGTIQPTFAKEVTEDNGLSGNLFGGFRNAETSAGDEGQKLESTKEASTAVVTDLTPMSLAQPMDQAQLEGLTVQQLRDLMQKMKISYRLIDSKEVLIRKILASKNS